MITTDNLYRPAPSSICRMLLTLLEHAIAYNGFMVLMLGILDNFLPEQLAQFLRTYLIGFLVNFLQAAGNITNHFQQGNRERCAEMLEIKLNCSPELALAMVGHWYDTPTNDRISIIAPQNSSSALLTIQNNQSKIVVDITGELVSQFPQLTPSEQKWLLHHKKTSIARASYRLLVDNQGYAIGALLAIAAGPVLVASGATAAFEQKLSQNELDFAVAYALTYFLRELGNYVQCKLSPIEFRHCVDFLKNKLFGQIAASTEEITPLINPQSSLTTENHSQNFIIQEVIPARTWHQSLSNCLRSWQTTIGGWLPCARRSRITGKEFTL